METGEVLVEGVAIAVEGVAGKLLAKAQRNCALQHGSDFVCVWFTQLIQFLQCSIKYRLFVSGFSHKKKDHSVYLVLISFHMVSRIASIFLILRIFEVTGCSSIPATNSSLRIGFSQNF